VRKARPEAITLRQSRGGSDRVTGPPLRRLSLRRAAPPQHAARLPLGHVKFRPDGVDAATAAGGAQSFPEAFARALGPMARTRSPRRISFSIVRSETALRSRSLAIVSRANGVPMARSFSRSFSRFTWATFSPPNSLRQRWRAAGSAWPSNRWRAHASPPIDRTASATERPCDANTSTCRSFATISSPLGFLAAVLCPPAGPKACLREDHFPGSRPKMGQRSSRSCRWHRLGVARVRSLASPSARGGVEAVDHHQPHLLRPHRTVHPHRAPLRHEGMRGADLRVAQPPDERHELLLAASLLGGDRHSGRWIIEVPSGESPGPSAVSSGKSSFGTTDRPNRSRPSRSGRTAQRGPSGGAGRPRSAGRACGRRRGRRR